MRAGGYALFLAIMVTLMVANSGSGTGAQLGAARLLYGMGRSGALPRSLLRLPLAQDAASRATTSSSSGWWPWSGRSCSS